MSLAVLSIPRSSRDYAFSVFLIYAYKVGFGSLLPRRLLKYSLLVYSYCPSSASNPPKISLWKPLLHVSASFGSKIRP
tara:strand:- start:227 stop:460 length:234 start_codon:yes stop_codon:yes gene_type:complete